MSPLFIEDMHIFVIGIFVPILPSRRWAKRASDVEPHCEDGHTLHLADGSFSFHRQKETNRFPALQRVSAR